MLHRKTFHGEQVSQCTNFLNQKCTYADEDCWFLHVEKGENLNTSYYECKSCSEKYTTRAEFMKHRKLYHSELVLSCRHADYGACMFGKENCWFIHDKSKINVEETKNDKNINEKFFEKILNMMEKMSERILNMENIKG